MAKYIGSTIKFMHGNPDGFGEIYLNSNLRKHNNLKRRMLAKQK